MTLSKNAKLTLENHLYNNGFECSGCGLKFESKFEGKAWKTHVIQFGDYQPQNTTMRIPDEVNKLLIAITISCPKCNRAHLYSGDEI